MIGVIPDWMDHRMSYDLTEYAGTYGTLAKILFEKTLKRRQNQTCLSENRIGNFVNLLFSSENGNAVSF